MAQYQVEKNGNQVTIWTDTRETAIRFTEGEALQRFTHTVIISRKEQVERREYLNRVVQEIDDLVRYAEELYPAEFADLQ